MVLGKATSNVVETDIYGILQYGLYIVTLSHTIILFTELSSKTVLQNRQLQETMRFDMHLFGNCRPSERTVRSKQAHNLRFYIIESKLCFLL